MPRTAVQKVDSTTIRDFSGGLNVAASEFSLLSKFQTTATNVIINNDNSFSVRPGHKLFVDTGLTIGGSDDALHFMAQPTTLAVTNASAVVTVTHSAHGMLSGYHVTLSGEADLGGIPAANLNRTHGIIVVDADHYQFVARYAATATTSRAANRTYTADQWLLSGSIVDGRYFQDYLIVVTDAGEIARVSSSGVVEVIWNYNIVNTRTPGTLPWRETRRVGFTTFKSRMIIVNGKKNDKPVVINNAAAFTCDYLLDPATSSNSAIPRGDWVFAFNSYVLILPSDDLPSLVGDGLISISALNTDSVYAGNAIPVDAVDFDITGVTGSIDPRITGVGYIRDKLVVPFYDSSQLGTLGQYKTVASVEIHKPDFSDSVAQHGCINGRTIACLGNDVLMTDYVGVPSISLSALSATIIPTRVSEYVDPLLQRNLTRLSTDQLANDAYSVFDTTDKRYMLFMPKYEEVPHTLPDNPILLASGLGSTPAIIINFPNHNIEAGDNITIAGASTCLDLAAADINGLRNVLHVIDANNIVVSVGAVYMLFDADLGGVGITVTPMNDGMNGYIYQTDITKKIRRWTRSKGLDFRWGAVSKKGTVFFGSGLKIYQMSRPDAPVSADYVGDYDFVAWRNSTTYTVGTKVKDGVEIWQCVNAHTSPATGTFANYRTASPLDWTLYVGNPIEWEVETPWSDFKQRGRNKNIRQTHFDTSGTARFTYMIFGNSIHFDPSNYQLAPQMTLDFAGGDAGGFGQSMTTFTGGRRTREEKLWSTPAQGKLIKLRFSGSTTAPLKFVAATLHYTIGSAHP